MNIELFITNIGYAFSFAVCLGLGILVLIKRPKSSYSPNVIFFLLIFVVCIWQMSYAIGINLHDPIASRFAFMFNLSTLFINILTTHLVLAISGRVQSQKRLLTILYAIAAGFVIFFMIFPNTFLLPSQPRLYMPNFLVPGSLYWLQDDFFFGVVFYFLWQVISTYRKVDHQMKNRLKYLIIGMIYGYIVALFPEFLLYGIQVDPIASCLTGLLTIPVAYAIIKYDAVDLNILAKRAFGYALSVAGVTFLVLAIGYVNDAIVGLVPGFPQWVVPLGSGILAVTIGVSTWKKMKETDVLKYEFITIIAHKFRTPLTQSKWATEDMLSREANEENIHDLKQIMASNDKLVNLTGALVDLANTDKNIDSLYRPEKVSLGDLIQSAVAGFDVRFKEKGILFSAEYPTADIVTSVDRERILFAVQTLLENSYNYTPRGGKVTISLTRSKRKALVSVTDTGIGIEKEELPRIFSSFYRTKKAQSADTEGFGIGLSLARSIVNRHGGKMEVSSEGEGKGSTFTIVLPIV